MKQMLRKADEEGRDPYIALLAYCNTAVTGMSYSPAQMLMNKVLNSKISILPALLEPKVVDPRPQLEQRQRGLLRQRSAIAAEAPDERESSHAPQSCVDASNRGPRGCPPSVVHRQTERNGISS